MLKMFDKIKKTRVIHHWTWAAEASCAEQPLATVVLAQNLSYFLFIDSLIRDSEH